MVMPRLSMRKFRETLRLAFEAGLGAREIGRSLSISHPTVLSYLSRARAKGLSWPLPEGLDDSALERLLNESKAPASSPLRPPPDVSQKRNKKGSKDVFLSIISAERSNDRFG